MLKFSFTSFKSLRLNNTRPFYFSKHFNERPDQKSDKTSSNADPVNKYAMPHAVWSKQDVIINYRFFR